MNTTLRGITQNKTSSSNMKSLLESGSYTGTGFRSGSINDIIAHDSCEFKHTVMRSRHDYSNICSMFEYIHYQLHLVAVAGKTLHNYPNPKVHAHQPQFNFLSDEHPDNLPQFVFLSDERPDFYQVIFNFMSELLIFHEPDFNPNGKLWKYGQCLFVIFLMHFDEFRLQFPTHFIITKLENLLYQYKLRSGTLIDWGKKIKKDFLEKNSVLPQFTYLPGELFSWMRMMQQTKHEISQI
jgi:hypothetical protein